jgi:Domain of unknown function (DUF4436)
MPRGPRRIEIVGALVAVGLAVSAFVVLGSVSSGVYVVEGTTATPAKDSIGLQIRAQSMATESGLLTLLLVPSASGAYGTSLPNGAYFTTPVLLNLDVSEGESLVSIPASSVIGGIPAAVSLTGSGANYPFDSYNTELFVSANSPGDGGGDEKSTFFLADTASPVQGYSITARSVSFMTGRTDADSLRADREAGFGYVQWNVGRSSATKFIALLMSALMVVGALTSLLITWSIVRGSRPPSINALVWLAAFLFALFQVRSQFPGDPGSGINLDRFVFFPVVLLLVLLMAVNLIAWSTREDWDMENPVFAIRGRIQRSLLAEGDDLRT